MRARRTTLLARILLTVPLGVLPAACSDDPVEPGSALVGTWNATSFMAMGQDFIAMGMSIRAAFASGGTYSFTVTGDLIGACDPNPDCVDTGTWSATTTQLTLDPGTADEEIFAYTIAGTVLTLTGDIDGTPVVIVFNKT